MLLVAFVLPNSRSTNEIGNGRQKTTGQARIVLADTNQVRQAACRSTWCLICVWRCARPLPGMRNQASKAGIAVE